MQNPFVRAAQLAAAGKEMAKRAALMAFNFGYARPPTMADFRDQRVNKYTPHQGKRECARRLRQRGMA